MTYIIVHLKAGDKEISTLYRMGSHE